MGARNPRLWGRFTRPRTGWEARPSVGTVRGLYGSAWRQLRARVLEEQPECHWSFPGCTIQSTQADHVIPLAAGGEPHSRSNVVGTCSNCHRRRTQAQGGRRRREP